MIFETHAHYDDEQFDTDREELLAQMRPAGIGRIINVSSELASVQTTMDIARTHADIYAAVGVHPSHVEALNEDTFAWLREQTAWEKTVAIGEIGLDYYWDKDPDVQERQRYWFGRQLDLARECGLPIIIHSRDAAADTMRIMQEHHAEEIPGVIHCYSYSVEMAREYVKMGYYIGVGGVVTFKNARKLVQTVEEVPLSRILLETDSPYLAPVPHRGTRNCSLYLPLVVARIAEIRQISTEEVEAATWENACRLFTKIR